MGEVEARRRDHQGNTIWKLAREPRFRWFGKFTRPRMQKKIRGFLDRVQCDQPGTVPLMVVMRHQGKGCSGTYRAGGEAEDRRTMKWYDDFVESVGDARVVIGFEPDSLGTVDCLARDRRQDRLDVLRYGVDRLSQLPNATVYLEAGASDWEPATRTAKQLRYIGISKVRGFMLNVTHHDWTRNNIKHGIELSRMVGGKHFIINTSYNGRGPLHYRKWLNKAAAQVAPDQRVVPPRASAASGRPRRRPRRIRWWTRTCTSTGPATRPARATAARCRWAPGGRTAALMYAAVRDRLGGAAQGHRVRPLQALLAARARRVRLERRGLARPRDPDDRRAGRLAQSSGGGSARSARAGGTRAGSSCRRGRS